MKIFETEYYKKFLKFKTEQVRGNLTHLAKQIPCHASYLLRIIHEEAHLTMDQAFALCKLWNLENDEQNYFLLLVQRDRSAHIDYRKKLTDQLLELQMQNNNLTKIVDRPEISESQALLEYHANWRTTILHLLTSSHKKNTKEFLAEKLKLPLAEVSKIIDKLNKMNLIEEKKGHFSFKKGIGHIPNGSPILPLFLNQWRQQAILDSYEYNVNHIHFSNVQTVSLSDLPKLIELSKNFINQSKQVCDRSGLDDVVVINLDVFSPTAS